MKRFLAYAVTLFLATVLSACKQANPNPEQLDPIYKDLEVRATAHQKAFEEATAKLTEAVASFEKAETNSVEKRETSKEVEKARLKVQDESQWARYYKIRLSRRLVEDKINYARAFAADTPWPESTEYRDYQLNRRLVESPRNWNLRVPKMPTRALAAESKPKAKADGHGE